MNTDNVIVQLFFNTSISIILIFCLWRLVSAALNYRIEKTEENIKSEEEHQLIKQNGIIKIEEGLGKLKKEWPLNQRVVFLGREAWVTNHYLFDDGKCLEVSWIDGTGLNGKWVSPDLLGRV